jgi:hypothetical protein
MYSMYLMYSMWMSAVGPKAIFFEFEYVFVFCACFAIYIDNDLTLRNQNVRKRETIYKVLSQSKPNGQLPPTRLSEVPRVVTHIPQGIYKIKVECVFKFNL